MEGAWRAREWLAGGAVLVLAVILALTKLWPFDAKPPPLGPHDLDPSVATISTEMSGQQQSDPNERAEYDRELEKLRKELAEVRKRNAEFRESSAAAEGRAEQLQRRLTRVR